MLLLTFLLIKHLAWKRNVFCSDLDEAYKFVLYVLNRPRVEDELIQHGCQAVDFTEKD